MEEGLRSVLDPFLQGGSDRDRLIEELERDILFLDRLLQDLHMQEALSLGDELAALQRSLFDDLEAGADLEDLSARVEQIQKLLAEMAQKMSQGAAQMPDAFANADAVQEMPTNEVGEMLEELREALEKGDREAARELAEKLLETLSRWMAALEEAAAGVSGSEMDPAMQELVELEKEIGEITAEQEEVLEQTRSVGGDASQRAGERFREEVESFLARQERRLKSIRQSARQIQAQAPRQRRVHGGCNGSRLEPRAARLPSPLAAGQRVEQGIKEVRKALKEDLGRAREVTPILGEAVQELRDRVGEQLGEDDPKQETADRHADLAKREIQGLLDDLDQLGRRRLQAVNSEEAGRLQGLSQREGGLAERTGGVAERLQNLARENPFLDPSLPKSAGSAQEAMGEAGNNLGRGDPFGAVPPETRALENLSELARKLQGARGQMGQGSPGQGFQIVRSPSGRGGGRDVDRSPVEIPKEMEARELRAFREEVLKAMRSGRYPKDYEKEVERYYERLIR
jgi:hypothetical protein